MIRRKHGSLAMARNQIGGEEYFEDYKNLISEKEQTRLKNGSKLRRNSR
jgi:hypothetical protein